MKWFFATATNSAYVLAVQLLALVTLEPAEFGSFSIQYLLFAFSSTLVFSLVSEAWLRADLVSSGTTNWREYSSATLYVASVTGLVTVAVSFLVEPLRPIAIIGAIAVCASVYRTSARFYSVRKLEMAGVLAGDIAGLVITLGSWAVLQSVGVHSLVMMSSAWAAGAIASALASKAPRILRPRSLADWMRLHHAQIRTLLGDSLLANVGAIGTPYLLAPMLGLAQFGVYRAVSNAAAPVRLVLVPLGPRIAAAPMHRQRSARRILPVLGVSIIFGVAAYVALLMIEVWGLHLGAVSALTKYAAPTGIFVAANFIAYYLSIVARAHLSTQRLLIGRISYAVFGLLVPLAAASAWGLSGAIWGYTACTALSSFVWLVLVAHRADDGALKAR